MTSDCPADHAREYHGAKIARHERAFSLAVGTLLTQMRQSHATLGSSEPSGAAVERVIIVGV